MGKIHTHETKRINRQIRNQVKELQKALKLAYFYMFMLTLQRTDTERCVLACINNDCYSTILLTIHVSIKKKPPAPEGTGGDSILG